MTFFVRLWDARLDLPREPDRQLVPVSTRRRSPTSRSSTSRWTTRSPTRATRSPTARASITIATVRPATILADVAVAVHPDDPRYRDAIGKEVVVPVVGRRVPVIADERVDPEFGSGALKITPGHDPIDFEIGRDHGLPTLTVVGPDGRVTAEGFEGLDQRRGRRARGRVAEGARPAREARELPPLGRHVRALPLADRAARLAAVVVPDGRARPPGDRGARGAARPLPPREPAPLRDRVARERARLVRLAPALVGPPDPDLDVPGRPPDVRVAAARGLRRVRLGRARPRPRRARHVVLVGALAVRDARLAGADARARPLLPGRRQRHRARDHPPLGEPDDLLRALPARRRSRSPT